MRITITILALALCATTAMAQAQHRPPKGANTIIVQPSHDGTAHIIMALVSQGFSGCTQATDELITCPAAEFTTWGSFMLTPMVQIREDGTLAISGTYRRIYDMAVMGTDLSSMDDPRAAQWDAAGRPAFKVLIKIAQQLGEIKAYQ